MFDLSIEKLAVLLVVALLVLGPERLPGFAASAARLLRQLRRMAQDASAEIRDELGPELRDVDLADLHPRRLISRHLFDPADADEPPGSVAAVAADGAGHAAGEHAAPFDAEAT
jgi:sec-independent protein translocase protein TatB